MSQQGERFSSHEDDWWRQLYDDAVADDTGPAPVDDTIDERFASARTTLADTPLVPPRTPQPPRTTPSPDPRAPRIPGLQPAAGPRRTGGDASPHTPWESADAGKSPAAEPSEAAGGTQGPGAPGGFPGARPPADSLAPREPSPPAPEAPESGDPSAWPGRRPAQEPAGAAPPAEPEPARHSTPSSGAAPVPDPGPDVFDPADTLWEPPSQDGDTPPAPPAPRAVPEEPAGPTPAASWQPSDTFRTSDWQPSSWEPTPWQPTTAWHPSGAAGTTGAAESREPDAAPAETSEAASEATPEAVSDAVSEGAPEPAWPGRTSGAWGSPGGADGPSDGPGSVDPSGAADPPDQSAATSPPVPGPPQNVTHPVDVSHRAEEPGAAGAAKGPERVTVDHAPDATPGDPRRFDKDDRSDPGAPLDGNDRPDEADRSGGSVGTSADDWFRGPGAFRAARWSDAPEASRASQEPAAPGVPGGAGTPSDADSSAAPDAPPRADAFPWPGAAAGAGTSAGPSHPGPPEPTDPPTPPTASEAPAPPEPAAPSPGPDGPPPWPGLRAEAATRSGTEETSSRPPVDPAPSPATVPDVPGAAPPWEPATGAHDSGGQARGTSAAGGPSAPGTTAHASPVPGAVGFVGDRPPTYDPEPTTLPEADPDGLGGLVADTVLDGARHGNCTLRAASVRGDSARYRGELRRDCLLTTRFGVGEQALVLVAMATGTRASAYAHLAAAQLCEEIGWSVGRHHAGLTEDIRAGHRGPLKAGLHRLTARAFGRVRARAEEQGLVPGAYTATLRCLLLPADPECRLRVFFGAGPGGLFRIRGGHWQDIEPYPADAPGTDLPSSGEPAEDHLTMNLGIPVPPGSWEYRADSSTVQHPPTLPDSAQVTRPSGAANALHAPEVSGAGEAAGTEEPPHVPFRFHAASAASGDVLLLCSQGLAEPLLGEPALAAHLVDRWGGAEPPGLAAFLADAQVRVKGYADDRTVAAVWEA